MKKIKIILASLIIGFGMVIPYNAEAKNKGDYSQNDVSVISGLSENQIKNILPTRMKPLANTLYRIEHSKKPISAIFLASVIRLETGNGTSYSYRARNNVGGIMGRKGLRSFRTKDESLLYMQDFLNRGYIPQGRKSVWRIGSKYCVGGNWSYKVNRLAISMMKKSWQ